NKGTEAQRKPEHINRLVACIRRIGTTEHARAGLASDPLPLRGCPPLQGGQCTLPLAKGGVRLSVLSDRTPQRDNAFSPLQRGRAAARRQGVAHRNRSQFLCSKPLEPRSFCNTLPAPA